MVSAADRSQPIQVEMAIADFQRVKGPYNQANSASESLIPLKQFQQASHTAVTIGGMNSRHVGMQVHHTIAQADDR
jgi:hypothetical protein